MTTIDGDRPHAHINWLIDSRIGPNKKYIETKSKNMNRPANMRICECCDQRPEFQSYFIFFIIIYIFGEQMMDGCRSAMMQLPSRWIVRPTVTLTTTVMSPKNHKRSGKIKGAHTHTKWREALMIISDSAKFSTTANGSSSRSKWNEKWMINNKNKFYYMNFIRLPGLPHAIESSNQPVHWAWVSWVQCAFAFHLPLSPLFRIEFVLVGVFVRRMRLCLLLSRLRQTIKCI